MTSFLEYSRKCKLIHKARPEVAQGRRRDTLQRHTEGAHQDLGFVECPTCAHMSTRKAYEVRTAYDVQIPLQQSKSKDLISKDRGAHGIPEQAVGASRVVSESWKIWM